MDDLEDDSLKRSDVRVLYTDSAIHDHS